MWCPVYWEAFFPCLLRLQTVLVVWVLGIFLSYFFPFILFVVVQLLSCIQLFGTVACQASLSLTISWSLLQTMSIESLMPSNHLILCCPRLFLSSTFPSIGVFSSELTLGIRWPRYWSFSLSNHTHVHITQAKVRTSFCRSLEQRWADLQLTGQVPPTTCYCN